MWNLRWLKRINIFQYVFSEHTIIAWMMTAAILPMLLFAFFAYKRAEATLESTISNMLLAEITKKVNDIDNSISSKKINLLQFSELPELSNIIRSSEKNGLQEVIDPKKIKGFKSYLDYITPIVGVSNLFLVGIDGKIIYQLRTDQLIGKVLSKADVEQSALYHAFDGARVISMPYIYTSFRGKDVSGLTIYLSNVINVGSSAKAVIILELNPYDIEKKILINFGYTKSDQTILGMLINSKPRVVISTIQQRNIDTPYTPTVNRLLRRAISGEMAMEPVNAVSIEGRPIVAIYSYVPQLNMGMIIEYDKAEVYWKMHWLKVNMTVLTLIDLLMVTMIVLWIASSLREAHSRSERLLENILPKFVANELKMKKRFLARHVENVSILFMDIMNFTPFSSSKPPEVVITILDDLFSILDHLSDQYQLEKIKTIGDAYMAASGLLTPQADHANRAVNMGLDAIEAIKQYNLTNGTDFLVRVGIGSGKVVAGIIGKKKFSYDLWGNSVNYASRMESTDLANEVQISIETYTALIDKDNYQFTLRQNVFVKGFGDMNTYLVSRRKTS